jgi:hypothetical protein
MDSRRNSTSSPFYNTGKKTNTLTTSNNSYFKMLSTLLIIVIILIIIYIIICAFNYYKTDCYTKKTFWSYLFSFNDSNVCIMQNPPVVKKAMPIINKPIIIKQNKPSELTQIFDKKEVYHISNQDYTYDQSRCKCNSYGGRLATKNEVTSAYNNGAHWCSYGWTEGQKAFYPVQKCNLNTDNNQENNDFLENSDKYCGKAGLNGGFFANPKLKFGVNCYGVKPKGSIVKPKKNLACPKKTFCDLPKNFQASHKLETDEIIGFNDTKWNM